MDNIIKKNHRPKRYTEEQIQDLELLLYRNYEQRFYDMKNYFVEKIDQFLSQVTEEYAQNKSAGLLLKQAMSDDEMPAPLDVAKLEAKVFRLQCENAELRSAQTTLNIIAEIKGLPPLI